MRPYIFMPHISAAHCHDNAVVDVFHCEKEALPVKLSNIAKLLYSMYCFKVFVDDG